MTVPIPLMPDWLQRISYVLPFRWTSDLPLRVYSGNIPVQEAVMSIGIQIIWIFVLVTLGFVAMLKPAVNLTRRIVVQSG